MKTALIFFSILLCTSNALTQLPDDLNDLIGQWVNEKENVGFEIKTLIGAEDQHVTSMSQLQLVRLLELNGEVLSGLVVRGVNTGELKYHFWQGTWMQSCNHYFTIISFESDSMTLEYQVRDSQMGTEPCHQDGEVIMYQLKRKLL